MLLHINNVGTQEERVLSLFKRNPKVSYAQIKERAAKKRLKMYPIMFGRAQLLLGIVKPKKKKAGKRGPGRPKGSKNKRGPGRPRKIVSAADAVRDLLGSLRQQEQDNAALRGALTKIRELIDRVV